jgi:transposase
MSARRYELSDFEWSVIEPLLPNKPRGVPRVDDRKVLNDLLAVADRVALGRHSRALRTLYHLL